MEYGERRSIDPVNYITRTIGQSAEIAGAVLPMPEGIVTAAKDVAIRRLISVFRSASLLKR